MDAVFKWPVHRIGMKCWVWQTILVLSLCTGNARSHDLHGPVIKSSQQADVMMSKVVNGVDASIAMFPYMALIGRLGRVHCGASIITDRVLLTVAHCLIKQGKIQLAKNLMVYVGSSKPLNGTKYKVCKVLPHNRYSDSIGYDIGLVLVRRRITLSPTVQLATLLKEDSWKQPGRLLTVIGFGRVTTYGAVAKVLQLTRMKFVDKQTCDKSQHGMNEPLIMPSHMFCLLGERWTSDCNGDSGSPVIWNRYVVGLVSAGRDGFCGSDVMPSMYTDVQAFSGWIRMNVKMLETHKCTKETRDLN